MTLHLPTSYGQAVLILYVMKLHMEPIVMSFHLHDGQCPIQAELYYDNKQETPCFVGILI